MQPKLSRKSERGGKCLVKVTPLRVGLDAGNDQARFTKYTISTMTRITIRM